MRLSYHCAVQRETDDACIWYDERKEGLGDEFFQELESMLGKIAQNPKAFPLTSCGRRRARLICFPYVFCYRELPDRVRILAVQHERRHPAYATGRE